jgi:hypothetical protein
MVSINDVRPKIAFLVVTNPDGQTDYNALPEDWGDWGSDKHREKWRDAKSDLFDMLGEVIATDPNSADAEEAVRIGNSL